MSLSITTNTAALKAGISLAFNSKQLQASMNRLSSGKKLSSPVSDPGSLAVAMKLQSAVNRLAGAKNNVQNASSFLIVQDGLLETVGNIISRMSELKGLGSQDPMKSDQDVASYNNEFRDLQLQLYDISQQKFNGVSLFANHTYKNSNNGQGATGADGFISGEVKFYGKDQNSQLDHTVSVHTSAEGGSGSKVSLHKAILLSALTLNAKGDDINLAGKSKNTANETSGYWSKADNTKVFGGKSYDAATHKDNYLTLASQELSGTLSLGQVSVGVITTALENISFLRAQNGGTQSRLSFNADSLAQQGTNMQTALGRIVDVDIAEETMKLATYNVLTQAAASMLAQANTSTDLALMLLR